MKLSFRKISIGPAAKRRIKRIVNWALNIYLTAFVLLVVWVLCQIFVFSSFSTPTESMTPNIVPGDYVLVNKFVMGGRLFNIFDALDGKQVNVRRYVDVFFNEKYAAERLVVYGYVKKT